MNSVLVSHSGFRQSLRSFVVMRTRLKWHQWVLIGLALPLAVSALVLGSKFAHKYFRTDDNSYQPAVSLSIANSKFLGVNGSDFTYKGQIVLLRGENFNNLPALGAKLGSGQIDDINITEEDYRQLDSFGANHVRFGLSYSWYKADRTRFFEVIDQHVQWAKAHRLWLIPLLFTTPNDCYEGYGNSCGIWKDTAEAGALQKFWVDFATHYKDEETIGGYDLLNEPTPPNSTAEQWFPLAQRIYNAILAVDPNHLVFIEAGSDAAFWHVFVGAKIVYEVHDYVPISLTHNDSGEYHYPGNAPDWNGVSLLWSQETLSTRSVSPTDLRRRLSIDWAAERKLPLYIGEWGTRNTYTGYDQYIKDRVTLFDTWKINYAHFQWRSADSWFGFYPLTGPLIISDEKLLNAAKEGWKGAIKPDAP